MITFYFRFFSHNYFNLPNSIFKCWNLIHHIKWTVNNLSGKIPIEK